MEKKVVVVDGYKLNLVFGKTKTDWVNEHQSRDTEGELWDFAIEDLLNGAIEPNEDMWYWCINGRLYETFETVE